MGLTLSYRCTRALLIILAWIVPLDVAPGAVQGRLVLLDQGQLEAPALAPRIDAPRPPIFRVDEHGWPIQSDAGFLQLADEGEGFVYATWLEGQHSGRGRSPDYGLENWGQIETFSRLARVVRLYERNSTTGIPLRISHISGEYGGFPDLRGHGYSGHVSHQTGNHVNVKLPPKSAGAGEIVVLPGADIPWDREGALIFLELAFRHGACFLFTNREVVDLASVPAERYPQLAAFPVPRPSDPANKESHVRADGAILFLFHRPGNHAEHMNVAFSPRE